MLQQVTTSELEHQTMTRESTKHGFKYFRFNPKLAGAPRLDVSDPAELDELLSLADE